MRSELLSLLVRGGRVPVARMIGVAILTLLAGVLVLAAIGIALASVFLGLEPWIGPAWSALATAGAALLTGGVALAIAARLQNRAHVPGAAELGSDIVQRYPLESATAALVAGVAVGSSADVRRGLSSALSSALERGL